jgi:GrpB-like predicted nucleotidyltransferase (UPF0157 family)
VPGEESLEQRVARVLAERISIEPYDSLWPRRFLREAAHLRACLPPELIGRIEHFGSTAVPGLAAKPIVDMLVEVTDLQAVRARIVPLLAAQGYDYFWRPTVGSEGPFYAWFIKRDARGERTHHIHMVEPQFHSHWGRLRFRDHLIATPDAALEYERLKRSLANEHGADREAYTRGKGDFIARIMQEIREAR